MSDRTWLDDLEELGPEKPKPPTNGHATAIVEPNLSPTIEDPRTRGSVRAAIEGSWQEVVTAPRGTRNHALNLAAFNLGTLVGNRLITEEQVRNHLMAACQAGGLANDDGEEQCRKTIESGLQNGLLHPRDNLPVMDGPKVTDGPVKGWDSDNSIFDEPATKKAKGTGPGARTIKLKSFHELEEKIPTWAWHFNGKGRVQLNTLSIFGGPPGTGKSTAARWFAAEASIGTLEGCWYGEPVNVAYLAIEEDLDAMVKPSLRAAGADMRRLFYPEVTMDETERILSSKADEAALTEQLLEHDIRLLIVDPIMSTLGAGTDIHRNNEVREAIQPFVNIASAMQGLVIGIAHYRKSGATSGVAALTGSSAFGEVARSVFGFMKGGMDPDEPRVMSQSKNSAGAEDLALQYALEMVPVPFPDGQSADMTRFKILGNSDVTVEDLMSEGGDNKTKIGEAKMWLEDYLQINGATDSKTVKKDGKTDGDFSDSTLVRAAGKLKVVMTPRSEPGRPRITVWSLPGDLDGLSGADRAAGPDRDF